MINFDSRNMECFINFNIHTIVCYLAFIEQKEPNYILYFIYEVSFLLSSSKLFLFHSHTPSSIFNLFYFLKCTISSMYISDCSPIISHPFLDFEAQCPSCCTQATYILSSTSFDSNYTFETPESFQLSLHYFICLLDQGFTLSAYLGLK